MEAESDLLEDDYYLTRRQEFEEIRPWGLLDPFCFLLACVLFYYFYKKYPMVDNYCQACEKKVGTYHNAWCVKSTVSKN